MNDSILYTIGHSNHSPERFVELLRLHSIAAVADVRSYPKSKYCPHFNRENLQQWLEESDIRYVFLGKELGGLRNEKECLTDGKVDYEKVTSLPSFQSGCERLRRGITMYRIAVLCAEKDPQECHRFQLVSRYLQSEFEIRHVLADGLLKTQEELAKQAATNRYLWELS